MAGRSVRAGAGLALALVVAGLVGCSADDSGDSSAGSAGDMAAVAPPQPGREAAPQSGDSATGAAGSDATTTSNLTIEPALIRTAELTVVVEDVPGSAARAAGYARSAGGQIAGDDRGGSGDQARATMVLKVPPGRMDGVLDQVGGLGEERQRTSSTEDVTEEVADIGSRVATMQASIARVRAILSRAEKIGDVVSVEGELSRRVTELEALQARQRALAGRVGLATITAHLVARSKTTVTQVEEERTGFVGGLQNGWDAFSGTVGWLLLVLGAVLPFLLVVVPVALAVRWALRRPRATRPAGTEPPVPAAG